MLDSIIRTARDPIGPASRPLWENPRMERSSPLARYLLAAYALLVIYGSLYPFGGWRDLGVAQLAFLPAPHRQRHGDQKLAGCKPLAMPLQPGAPLHNSPRH